MEGSPSLCVAGVFRTREKADAAVRALIEGGSDRDDIGVLSDAPPELQGAGGDAARGEGLRKGLLAGGVIGAIGGIALEATVLAIPGAGPFMTGGVLAAALAGGGAGAGAGALTGALVRLGLSDTEAADVARALAKGGVLVTVNVPDRFGRERVRSVLRSQGALETTDVGAEEQDTHFIRGFTEFAPGLREHFDRTYGAKGERWEDRERQYRYGWQLANRPDHLGRSWEDSEADLRSEWETRHPDVPWDGARVAIEQGFRSLERREKRSG